MFAGGEVGPGSPQGAYIHTYIHTFKSNAKRSNAKQSNVTQSKAKQFYLSLRFTLHSAMSRSLDWGRARFIFIVSLYVMGTNCSHFGFQMDPLCDWHFSLTPRKPRAER